MPMDLIVEDKDSIGNSANSAATAGNLTSSSSGAIAGSNSEMTSQRVPSTGVDENDYDEFGPPPPEVENVSHSLTAESDIRKFY